MLVTGVLLVRALEATPRLLPDLDRTGVNLAGWPAEVFAAGQADTRPHNLTRQRSDTPETPPPGASQIPCHTPATSCGMDVQTKDYAAAGNREAHHGNLHETNVLGA